MWDDIGGGFCFVVVVGILRLQQFRRSWPVKKSEQTSQILGKIAAGSSEYDRSFCCWFVGGFGKNDTGKQIEALGAIFLSLRYDKKERERPGC